MIEDYLIHWLVNAVEITDSQDKYVELNAEEALLLLDWLEQERPKLRRLSKKG